MSELAQHSNACPTFFRALVWEARNGVQGGYFGAGHELARHAYSVLQADFDDVDIAIEPLLEGINEVDGDAVWSSLKRLMPRCMALVPSRRKHSFIDGFLTAMEDAISELVPH